MTTEDSNHRATEGTEQKGHRVPRGYNWSDKVRLSLEFLDGQEAAVVLQVGDEQVELDCEEARDIGQALLTLATAADWDENFPAGNDEEEQ